MKNLSIEQLESIPWNKKYNKDGEYPPEPELSEIVKLLDVPFLKRDINYGLFYCWNEIIDLVEGNQNKVLDTACGNGQISQVLHLYGNNVFACDIEDCFTADEEIKFTKTDLNKVFPYNENEFDYIINSTSLHYLNESSHYFAECKRILKKNGYLIFSLPNIQAIGNRLYFLRTGNFPEYSNAILSRKNFLYPDYIFELLLHLGFEVIEIRGAVPIKSFKIFLLNMFLKKSFFIKKDLLKDYSAILIIKAQINKT